MAASEPVVVDTADLAPGPVASPAHVRIGGNLYLAHPPKDTVLMGMGIDSDSITAATSLEMIFDMVRAMFETDAAEQIIEMMRDPANDEVTAVSVTHVLDILLHDPEGPQWEQAVSDAMAEMGSGKTPTTVKMPKAQAKKPAAKKPAPKRR